MRIRSGIGAGVSFADEANWLGTASTAGTIDLDNLVDNHIINIWSGN